MTAPTVVRAAKSGSGGKGSAAADVPAKKSKKKLIIIVVVVLVVVAAAYHFVLAKKPAKTGPPVEGAVVSMTAMTLNLADGHFLKLQLALQEIKGKEGTVPLDTSKAADLAIQEFSGLPMAQLVTNESKEAKKADLLKQLEVAYPGVLMGLYYTTFVTQ
jgi:flagellar FliL protein